MGAGPAFQVPWGIHRWNPPRATACPLITWAKTQTFKFVSRVQCRLDFDGWALARSESYEAREAAAAPYAPMVRRSVWLVFVLASASTIASPSPLEVPLKRWSVRVAKGSSPSA